MLSEDARGVIGVPHPSGRAAMRMLEHEGFAYEGYVDIFDGGPTMIAHTDNVKSIREAHRGIVTTSDLAKGEKALIAAGRLANFRCCYGAREVDGEKVEIDTQSADMLGVGEGDEVWSIAR
jgi:arginine N-succinyltransferase